MTDMLKNRLLLVVLTAVASPLGVWMATAYAQVHSAFCFGGL